MAIDPFLYCRDTDVHVQSQKIFYPTKIPVLHHQLRHLISSPLPNLIYFVNLKDVYCLDTKTKKRTHITELLFEPRCTASGHGWFCAGGDKHGYFAAIRIPEHPSPDGAVVDGPCTNGSDRSSSVLDRLGLPGRSLPPRVRVETLGEDIVNSISIHRLPGNGDDILDEVVAVLTNNDQTVRIFSLTQDKELNVYEFEFPMNHATISPNGKLLMIVGDKEFGYFYGCSDQASQRNKSLPNTSPQYPSSNWTFLRRFRLHKPQRMKHSAYFTTAWSASGKLCATASEEGFITVFDTEALMDMDSDPVVALVPSSRPNTVPGAFTPGAVRTMFFAPEPWDLLIWTEAYGRVCFGDLRTGLKTRQVVHLDQNADDVRKIELTDASHVLEDSTIQNLDLELDFLRRQHRNLERNLGQLDNAAAVSFATDYLERRRQQRLNGGSMLDEDPHGLTEQEQQILDGLRTTREREESLLQNNGSSSQERRPSQRGTSNASSSRNSAGNRAARLEFERRQLATEESLLREFDRIHGGQLAVLNSIRDYLRDASLENDSIGSGTSNNNAERDRPSPQQPRRRNSVVLTPPSNNNDTSLPSSRHSPSPSTSGTITDSPAWRTIQAVLDHSNPPSQDSSAANNTRNAENGNNGRQDSSDSQVNADSNTSSTSNQYSNRLPTSITLPSSSSSSNTQRGNAGNLTSSSDADMARRLRQWAANDAALGARQEALRTRAEALTTRGEAMAARALRDRENQWRRDYEATLFRRVGAGVPGGTNGVTGTTGNMRMVVGSGSTAEATREVSGGVREEYDPEHGVGTAGLAWGDGGRILYVGTVDGIFELQMSFHERKFWPATDPR